MTEIKSLTVGELRKALEGVPDDVPVLIDNDDVVGLRRVSATRSACVFKRNRPLHGGGSIFYDYPSQGAQPAFVLDATDEVL